MAACYRGVVTHMHIGAMHRDPSARWKTGERGGTGARRNCRVQRLNTRCSSGKKPESRSTRSGLRPSRSPSRVGPHLAASAILRCQECHSQLTEEDANRSGLVRMLMRVRRQHSVTDRHSGKLPDVVATCRGSHTEPPQGPFTQPHVRRSHGCAARRSGYATAGVRTSKASRSRRPW